jgi:hypothetical protein
MSAMRNNAIETTSGRARSRILPALMVHAPKLTNTLQEMAIAAIRYHAAIGIRFHTCKAILGLLLLPFAPESVVPGQSVQ